MYINTKVNMELNRDIHANTCLSTHWTKNNLKDNL